MFSAVRLTASASNAHERHAEITCDPILTDNSSDAPRCRAYDPKTAQWAIWWIDGRDPSGAWTPPVKGRFVNGVGTFYSDGMLEGKPIRTRFIWSHITPTSARWEQAYSSNSGKTWETNWIMEFQRVR